MSAAEPSAVRIERACAADAPAILALESAFPSDRMSARSVRRFIRSPAACVLVARLHGETVGALVLMLRRNSCWARIYSVAVEPQRRGLGLGRRLIEAAEDQARERGCSGISLEVRADNGIARRLYASMGYHDDETLPGYYEDGAPGVRLRKALGETAGIAR